MIGKSGSSAIAKAIYIDGGGDVSESMLLSERPIFQKLVSKTQDANRPMMPVRDPVERFTSACLQENRTPSQQIVRIELGIYTYHTKPTSAYLVEGATLYKFPEHIKEIARDLGIDKIPKVNDSLLKKRLKPILNEEEIKRVRELYKEDLILFNSIKNSGQIYQSK